MSPRRRYPRPLIYEQLAAEQLFDPLAEEPPMARHYDLDGDGVLDHLQDEPVVDSGLPTGVPDTGDAIDPDADDPTGDEITHPDHADYVEPWEG